MYKQLVWKVALVVGLFGLIMSRRQVLEWIAPMSSVNALFIWYVCYAVFLSALGFWVIGMRWDFRYTLALVLVTWALGIVLYFPLSPYSTEITGAEVTGVEAATEDFVTNQALESMGVHDSTGIVTYAVIPAILILIAGFVVAPNFFSRIFHAGVGRA